MKYNEYCLDFSSAFDTVDHSLLIQQLENFFGISGFCLKWLSSYLSNRISVVSINNSHSSPSSFPFGVLQGSDLGLLLFILYTSELPRIISTFSLQSQLYADDFYIFTSFPKYESSSTISKISLCISKKSFWSVPQTQSLGI